ncbi:MAG: hypothetical protein AAF495_28510 [Pseudomonadota bacterium]
MTSDPSGERPNHLLPREPGAGKVEIATPERFGGDILSELGGWCVGAAALLVRASDPPPTGKGALLTPPVRQALVDFGDRLELVLNADLSTLAKGPETEFESLPIGVRSKSRAPGPGSALDRLVEGPVHRVIRDVASDDHVRRRQVVAALTTASRTTLDPVTVALPQGGRIGPRAKDRGVEPRRSPRGDRPAPVAVSPYAIVASALTARLVPGGPESERFAFDRPLLDSKGVEVGAVDGHYEIRTGPGAR